MVEEGLPALGTRRQWQPLRSAARMIVLEKLCLDPAGSLACSSELRSGWEGLLLPPVLSPWCRVVVSENRLFYTV